MSTGTEIPPLARGIVNFEATRLVDEDGRPVAEVASPIYDRVTTEVVACPYADVRQGGPMNRSALRQMSAVWPELLGCMATLAGPAPTVGAAWAAAVTGTALPLACPQPVPRLVAGLFKASLGLSQVFSAMCLSAPGVAGLPLSSLGRAPDFFRALDQGRWLVGAEQVCAGSRSMIEEAFDALNGGSGAAPPAVAALVRAVGHTPPRVVALHAAYLAACARAARTGDGVAPAPGHPWLRAVFAVPNRPPDHALRFFADGGAPEVLVAFVEAGPAPRGELDARFSAALAEA